MCRLLAEKDRLLAVHQSRRTDMDFLTPRTSKTGEKLIDKADESPIIWPVPLLTEKVCDVGGQLVRLIERNYAVRL